jgi:lysophospholipase L1-like esterase
MPVVDAEPVIVTTGRIATNSVGQHVDARPVFLVDESGNVVSDSLGPAENYTPANRYKYRLALAKTAAGASRTRVGFIGDSTTAGLGAGTSGVGNINGSRAKSVPTMVKKLLGHCITSRASSTFGTNNMTSSIATLQLYDPRLSIAGSSWSTNNGIGPAGALYSASGTDAITFTPGEAFDTVVIWYVRGTGNATVSVTDQDGTLGSVNANGATAVLSASVSRVTPSTKAINIQRTGGNDFYLIGIEVYDSTTPSVDILNLGASGTLSSNWSSGASPWSAPQFLPSLACDLWVLNLGINDNGSNVDTATYKANMQTIITYLKNTGDVLLIGSHPRDSQPNPSLTGPYKIARRELAVTNGAPLIELDQRFVTYAASSAMYDDAIHLKAWGYADIAAAIVDAIRPR